MAYGRSPDHLVSATNVVDFVAVIARLGKTIYSIIGAMPQLYIESVISQIGGNILGIDTRMRLFSSA
jgi:hypothetical protein